MTQPCHQNTEAKRTAKQNASLHLYCEQLADCLNTAGLDMRIVLKPSVEISWTKDNVKKYLWKPVQKALTKKDSTTQLDKKAEIDFIWKNLNRHLVKVFGEFAEFPQFPSEEEVRWSKLNAKKIK